MKLEKIHCLETENERLRVVLQNMQMGEEMGGGVKNGGGSRNQGLMGIRGDSGTPIPEKESGKNEDEIEITPKRPSRKRRRLSNNTTGSPSLGQEERIRKLISRLQALDKKIQGPIESLLRHFQTEIEAFEKDTVISAEGIRHKESLIRTIDEELEDEKHDTVTKHLISKYRPMLQGNISIWSQKIENNKARVKVLKGEVKNLKKLLGRVKESEDLNFDSSDESSSDSDGPRSKKHPKGRCGKKNNKRYNDKNGSENTDGEADIQDNLETSEMKRNEQQEGREKDRYPNGNIKEPDSPSDHGAFDSEPDPDYRAPPSPCYYFHKDGRCLSGLSESVKKLLEEASSERASPGRHRQGYAQITRIHFSLTRPPSGEPLELSY